MNLEQIAQQAMSYLDSVGVAADWEIDNKKLYIETDKHAFIHHEHQACNTTFRQIAKIYPQKSPS